MAAYFTVNGGTAPLMDLSYEVAVGISPQCLQVTIAPLPATGLPDVLGTVAFGDGLSAPLVLRDCRLANFQEVRSDGGIDWRLQILDRRWKWREGHPWYDGCQFNQLDDRKKLIPWTVRSPHQLAVMCLTRMGETPPVGGWNFAGVLPGGLAVPGRATANPPVPDPGPADVLIDPGTDYLHLGENLPPTGTNPPVEWKAMPAAVCLAELVERYGAVVVWNPVTDRVSIERLGSGSPLPSGPVWPVISGTVSVAPMVLPERITVVGAPVRFQPRLCFRPVGRDWDDGYYPWTEVTYAPTNGAPGDPWQRSMPPSYPNVTPTARLNYFQARALASESILRDFQLWCADPANTADKRIPVPGLNRFLSPASTDSDGVTRVDNRFRIILQNTRPEQVVPRPGDQNRIDPQTGQPFAAEFYNGYAKDRPPVSFGSIAVGAAGTRQFGFWGNRATIDAHGNTPAKSAFYVPFSIIDPLRQIIRYSAHIFRLVRTNVSDKSTARLKPPGEPLVVETGCLVLHPDTYAPVCYQYDLVLGGPGPAVVIYREDVQAEMISQYNANHVPTGAKYLDADAESRARYYAQAAAYAYQAPLSQTVRAVGLYPVILSGVVRCVGWHFSPGGFDTTASANSEYSPNVPPYPQRRFAENRPADPVQAGRNIRGIGSMRAAPGNAAEREVR